MYKALYRKWRPARFADVVGQGPITTALENQIKANRLGHAYLFTGSRGTGKTSCAKIFAKAVNCENRNGGAEPCGECVCCTGLDNGSILDVIEIDAASNNGVDDVRDLREETAYRPSRCAYKVYIIDEVHMLSTAAFNALLKIMEEPPSHVIFILATTEVHKIPATILSRCQRFDFMRIPAEKIAGRLAFVAGEEGIDLEPAAAGLIARLADGAMRDALSLLDTCAGAGGAVDEEAVRKMAGVTDKLYLFALSDAVNRGDIASLITLVTELRNRSIDVKRLAEELVFHYRNFILAKAAPNGALLEDLPEKERGQYLEAAAALSQDFPVKAVARLAEALDKIGRSPEPRVELELALFALAGSGSGIEVQPVAIPVAVPAAQPLAQPAAAKSAAKPAEAAAPAQNSALPDAARPPWEAPTPAQADEPDEIPQGPGDDDVPPPQEPPDDEPAMLAQPVPPAAEEPALPAPAAGLQGQTVAPDADEFAEWPKIVAAMAKKDAMLYTYMKKSHAYLEGGKVALSGSDVFLDFIGRDTAAFEKIKNLVAEVCGRPYTIAAHRGGPPQAAAADASAQQTLREWENKGVVITYE